MNLRFEWDNKKAEQNLLKHGISFIEAVEVFYDLGAFIFEDIKHSVFENRELIIGYSKLGKLLIVCFTLRNDKIRIINARQTNKKEREKYEKNTK